MVIWCGGLGWLLGVVFWRNGLGLLLGVVVWDCCLGWWSGLVAWGGGLMVMVWFWSCDGSVCWFWVVACGGALG